MIRLTPEQRAAATAKSVATRKANKAIHEAARRDAYERRHLLKTEIEQLEAKLSGLRKVEAMDVSAAHLTGHTLFREQEIVAVAQPWRVLSGVYFLVDVGRVVYVGQSVNVYARIAQHTGKVFTDYVVIPCAVDSLDALESLYIHTLRPPLNTNGATVFAPLTAQQLAQAVNSRAPIKAKAGVHGKA